jgi:bla regulator protein BlaR1
MNALEQMFQAVWQTSISAAVLIVVCLVVLVSFRNVLPAWARYAVWLLVFLRLMIPVAPPASFSIWNLGKSGERPLAPVVIAEPAGYKPAIRQTQSLRYESNGHLMPVIWFLGVIGWIGVAVIRHQRFAGWVKRQAPCTDPRVLSLVGRARGTFAVSAKIAVICSDSVEAPAVFGVWRPRLLLPTRWVQEANDEELYTVLLHELAHVKNRDALLNWICIFIRGAHWFNPLVWYAFQRLRRERELFCDALVLARLRPTERTAYGAALIKIAGQLSGSAAPATLVPVLQYKPEIHRRIHMIAKYKSTPWIVSAGFAILLTAVAGLTFTRAADKPAPQPTPATVAAPKERAILEEEVAKQRELVRQLQGKVADLRASLSDGQSIDASVPSRHSETLRALESRRIEAQAELRRLSALLTRLTKQGKTELRASINTASPDTHLSDLMKNYDLVEQKLAELLEERGPEHPECKRITRVLKQVDKQIDDRIVGILRGMELRIDVEQEQLKALLAEISQAKADYLEGLHRSRPYQEALQELRAQEEILQRLRLRMAEERLERAIEGAKRN